MSKFPPLLQGSWGCRAVGLEPGLVVLRMGREEAGPRRHRLCSKRLYQPRRGPRWPLELCGRWWDAVGREN